MIVIGSRASRDDKSLRDAVIAPRKQQRARTRFRRAVGLLTMNLMWLTRDYEAALITRPERRQREHTRTCVFPPAIFT